MKVEGHIGTVQFVAVVVGTSVLLVDVDGKSPSLLLACVLEFSTSPLLEVLRYGSGVPQFQ